MRFPGNRNPKHYFPVTRKVTRLAPGSGAARPRWYAVGLDEVIVDLEVAGPRALGEELGFEMGESVQLSPEQHRRVLARLEAEGLSVTYASPGGTVANTLNNYTHLSGEPAVLLGAIQSTIRPGDPAYAYLCQTSKAVDLRHLLPLEGPTGTAITFVAEDGERSFGVAPGVAGDYPADAVPEHVVRGASVALLSLYGLRPRTRPIAEASLRVMAIAREAGVPVAFGLGTANLVRELRDVVREVLAEYVTVAAMNHHEARALTGHDDVLLAAEELLELVDIAIITEGQRGLTIGGWTDHSVKRETDDAIRSKSIPEYNRWEYSRLMHRADCDAPLKVYSHTHPYQGGPAQLINTNGAGDAALAALLHDISANRYHREAVPNSSKHDAHVPFLTYSSLSRNAQYGNRVAYEVLCANTPRLDADVGHDAPDADE